MPNIVVVGIKIIILPLLVLFALFFSAVLKANSEMQIGSNNQECSSKKTDIDDFAEQIRQALSQPKAAGEIKINLTVVGENATVKTINGTRIIGFQQLINNIIVVNTPLEILKPKKIVSESGELIFEDTNFTNRPSFNENLFIKSKDKNGVSYLNQLRKKLEDNPIATDVQLFRNNPAKSYTISGIGGVGKTQLAIAYIYEYEKNYDFICWINAENKELIIQAYRDSLIEIFDEEICRNDGISIDSESLAKIKAKIAETINGRSEKEIVNLFIKKLSKRFEHWLLVYDNVENAAQIKRLTPNTNGHIIITSRNRNWSQSLELDVFQLNEAIDYLFNATGRERTALEEEQAKQVAEIKLGCLPLALAQAAAYIKKCRINFQDYLEIFEKEQKKLLEYKLPKDNYYEQVVMTAWDVTMNEIAKHFPQANIVMNRCAYLASDDIPLLFFSNTEFSKEKMLEAIRELDDYSMVIFKKDKTSVHRLVQTVIRIKLERDSSNKVIIREIASLLLVGDMLGHNNDNGTYDARNVTIGKIRILLPHVLSLINYVGHYGINENEQVDLCIELSTILRYQHQSDIAERFLDRALYIAEQTKYKISDIYSSFLWIYKNTEQLEKIEAILDKNSKEPLPFLEKGDAVDFYSILYRGYIDRNNLKKANGILKQMKDFSDKLKCSWCLADTLSNLCFLRYVQDRPLTAIQRCEEALQIFEDIDPASDDVFGLHIWLAVLHDTQGDVSKKEYHSERAKELYPQMFFCLEKHLCKDILPPRNLRSSPWYLWKTWFSCNDPINNIQIRKSGINRCKCEYAETNRMPTFSSDTEAMCKELCCKSNSHSGAFYNYNLNGSKKCPSSAIPAITKCADK